MLGSADSCRQKGQSTAAAEGTDQLVESRARACANSLAPSRRSRRLPRAAARCATGCGPAHLHEFGTLTFRIERWVVCRPLLRAGVAKPAAAASRCWVQSPTPSQAALCAARQRLLPATFTAKQASAAALPQPCGSRGSPSFHLPRTSPAAPRPPGGSDRCTSKRRSFRPPRR